MNQKEKENAERFVGLSTFELAREVVVLNPQVDTLTLQAYNYVPNKPSNPDENIFYVNREEFLQENVVEQIISGFTQDFNLALNSKCFLENNTVGHFQMMDLAPRKSEENQQKVIKRFKEIITPKFGAGLLIETNKSYQYLGFDILSQNAWLDFLGTNLVTSIVTQVDENEPRVHEFISDYRYIGYSILRRFTGLRLTTRGTKSFEPKTIAILT